ncbi:MAG: TRAP-type uncharacterized transport system substrate-binding protein [Bradymonadia bacterium]|jgi:TRAP-type uncharacterized transport system substrate-binding protein
MRTFALLGLSWLLVVPAAQAKTPTLRLCTGAVGDHYHRLGITIAAKVRTHATVEVIATRGSWDNLERIDSEPPRCDAILAQDDAWALYQFEKPKSALMMDRVAVAYPEFVHLLCNAKAGIERADQLDAARHTVLLNGVGSGTFITWGLMARLNSKLAPIKTRTAAPEAALAEVAANTAPMCMLLVTATGGRTLSSADTRHGSALSLVTLGGAGLHRKVGRERRAVYADAQIAAGTYTGLAQRAVATQTVDAVFFINPEWRARHPAAARRLAAAVKAR